MRIEAILGKFERRNGHLIAVKITGRAIQKALCLAIRNYRQLDLGANQTKVGVGHLFAWAPKGRPHKTMQPVGATPYFFSTVFAGAVVR
ncbi:MAG: hypothetical protein ACYCO5_02530 [Acidobacteriaceae bacterium]